MHPLQSALVVDRVLRVSQVKDDTAVGASTATGLKDALKVDGAVEVQAAILEHVNPVSLVVTGSVDDGDLFRVLASLSSTSACSE